MKTLLVIGIFIAVFINTSPALLLKIQRWATEQVAPIAAAASHAIDCNQPAYVNTNVSASAGSETQQATTDTKAIKEINTEPTPATAKAEINNTVQTNLEEKKREVLARLKKIREKYTAN